MRRKNDLPLKPALTGVHWIFTFMRINYPFLTVQFCLCYRTFGGRPNESLWITEAQNLADLTMKEPGVVRDHYYLNWYDPPLQLFNRLNEVWIVKNMSKKNPPKAIKNQNDLNEVCWTRRRIYKKLRTECLNLWTQRQWYFEFLLNVRIIHFWKLYKHFLLWSSDAHSFHEMEGLLFIVRYKCLF